MGINCCKYPASELATEQRGSAKQHPPPDHKILTNSKISDSESLDQQSSVLLFNIFGEDQIKQMLDEAERLLAAPAIRTPNNLLLEEKLKLYQNQVNIWFQMSDLPSGNKLHHYYSETECPLPAEAYYLFQLNLNNKRMTELDSNINSFELISYAVKEDTIITVTRTTTTKILMIEPKTFFVVRIVRRIDKDTFIEVQHSVELTPLINNKFFKDYLDGLKNVAQVHINAVKYQTRGGKLFSHSYNKVDLLSGIGPMIIKSGAKGRLRTFQNNLQKRATQFICIACEPN